MGISNHIGNIPLPEAFACINVISKKKDFSKFREQFITGFRENCQTWETSEEIFDQLVKFAPYCFNKAHAVAYARITYITAYLKSHYPEEFNVGVREVFPPIGVAVPPK